MKTLRTIYPIARKEHKCDYCNGTIKIGEMYEYSVHVYNIIYTWKSHFKCRDIANKLDMFDNCEEGLTSDAFVENIDECYSDINLSEDSHANFTDRLDSVIKHYSLNQEK